MPVPCDKLGMSAVPDSRQLRELLATDRRGAGEARRQQTPELLRTASYRQPLWVQLKRRWRLDRRLRARVGYGCLMLVLALAAWLFAGDQLVKARAVGPAQRSLVAHGPVQVPGSANRPRLVPVHASLPSSRAQEAARRSLPAQVRLQRADLWLRVSGVRAAREARALLQSALEEVPDHAHGQAALAQACLRLNDEGCAKRAIAHAIRVRPQRAKYQALSAQVEAHFDGPRQAARTAP